MNAAELTGQRLMNQHIAAPALNSARQVVSWLGAVQAQDYGMAKWAIGLRAAKLNDTAVEKAFNEGAILRTHVLRPTWHFVSPEDIRWMLALTAPQVQAANAYMYRKMELNTDIFTRSTTAIANALAGGRHLTRTALQAALAQHGISADGVRLVCLMMFAELEGVICSGPRQGKQFTYALLDERVAPAPVLYRQEALQQLALRYFSSRAPATVKDFAWWSGLSQKDAAAGALALAAPFTRTRINGNEYILNETTPPIKGRAAVFLLPVYDEYIVSYKDRSAIADPAAAGKARNNLVFQPLVILNGQVAGTWRKIAKGKQTLLETNLFTALNKTGQAALQQAAERYHAFNV